MRYLYYLGLLLLAGGCTAPEEGTIEGRPGGPYRMTLTSDPIAPQPGEVANLSFALTYANSGKPVSDLQVAHERLLHNFITKLDFTDFAHIHHEDFAPLDDGERRAAVLRFPYRFPSAGRYRIVSEFVHRDRSWTKHFDIDIGTAQAAGPAEWDLSRIRDVHAFRAELSTQPELPVAGFETQLNLHLTRDGLPVSDLALYLGTELHGAVWRDDGKNFGHLHSYTPKVAAIMQLAHDRGVAPQARGPQIAQMMAQLMCLESELVFPGPDIPMRYVFPEPGIYHLFFQVAPHGKPQVFHFAIEVAAPGGADSP